METLIQQNEEIKAMQNHEIFKLQFDNQNLLARLFDLENDLKESALKQQEGVDRYNFLLEEVNDQKVEKWNMEIQ